MLSDKTKEAQALDRIGAALAEATQPIVLWSSGKDSTVVLHLTLRLQTVPVMWWRLAKFPEKAKHGMWVARIWDLELYDAMPLFVEEVQNGNWWEAVHGYGPDHSSVMAMTTGILPMKEGEPYLCAVSDLLSRPTVPSQGWPWDVMLQGHREKELPYFGSKQKFSKHTVALGGKTLCNPIFDWSDDEVWGYVKRYRLPIDKMRYFGKNTDVSPDHYPTCYNCLDSRKYGQMVDCPKMGVQIPSVAKHPSAHKQTLEQIKAKVPHVRYTGNPQQEVSTHV